MRASASILVALLFSASIAGVSAQGEPAAGLRQAFVPPANDPGWRPTANQQGAVEQATMSYFAARDGNNPDDAYGRISAKLKQILPFAAYRKSLKDFNAISGQAQDRHLRAMTWYKDVPQVGPGLYVAVDYSSRFPNLALHCGYVVWQEQSDGSFLLVREEANFIDNATAIGMSPEDIEKIRSEYRC